VSLSFVHDRPRRTWSDARHHWLSVMASRLQGVVRGAAFLVLPDAASTSARLQPTPVFLLDHDCGVHEQAMVFRVSSSSAAVGLLVGAQSLTGYTCVVLKGAKLSVIRQTRRQAVVLAAVRVPRVVPGRTYRLVVHQSRRRLHARVEPASSSRPWQLRLDHAARTGMVGVVMLGGPQSKRTRLEVDRYWLRAASVSRTPMREQVLLSGAPDTSGAAPVQRVRVVAERPCLVSIQVADDPDFTSIVETTTPVAVTRSPFHHAHRFVLPVSGARWWRAHLVSPSGAARLTPAQRVSMPDASEGFVVAAASCCQLWDADPYLGFHRLTREAAPSTPVILAFEGDMGYVSNGRDQAFVDAPDYWFDRVIRFLMDPYFVELRQTTSVVLTMDDHDYGFVNNADRTTLRPWSIKCFDDIHADRSNLGYVDWSYGDVHFVTLDGRRYCDPVTTPESPSKTKLGAVQKAWLENILTTSDAKLFVLCSADTWALRGPLGSRLDTFPAGWKTEYTELMTLFHTVQLGGVRVLILSGDAHSQRIHYHTDPQERPGTDNHPVVEFICSGLRARSWSGPDLTDPTLDPARNVESRSGLGMMEVASPSSVPRTITLRSINGDDGDLDLFPPLTVPFTP
jgi:hypothetical protein